MGLRLLAVLSMGLLVPPAWGQPPLRPGGPPGHAVIGPGTVCEPGCFLGRELYTPKGLQVYTRDKCVNRMRITEVTTAPALPLPAMPPARNGGAARPPVKGATPAVPPVGAGKGGLTAVKGNAVLRCSKWNGGRIITDDQGRIWTMIQGSAEQGNPQELTGWLLEGDGNATHFFSSTGRLYRLVKTAALCAT
jgi:hypothetical protein